MTTKPESKPAARVPSGPNQPKRRSRTESWSRRARIAAGIALPFPLAWTGLTVSQVFAAPANPGWWMLLWVFGGALFAVLGIVLNRLGREGPTLGLLALTYALGVLAVPFAVSFAAAPNLVIGLVAALVGVPFVLAGRAYLRRTAPSTWAGRISAHG